MSSHVAMSPKFELLVAVALQDAGAKAAKMEIRSGSSQETAGMSERGGAGSSQSARRGDERLLRPPRGAELWVYPRFKCGCTVKTGPLRS